MESTHGLVLAAEKHLELLRDDHDRVDSLDRYYVVNAYGYGVEPARIAELSGIPMGRVQTILAGV